MELMNENAPRERHQHFAANLKSNGFGDNPGIDVWFYADRLAFSPTSSLTAKGKPLIKPSVLCWPLLYTDLFVSYMMLRQEIQCGSWRSSTGRLLWVETENADEGLGIHVSGPESSNPISKMSYGSCYILPSEAQAIIKYLFEREPQLSHLAQTLTELKPWS